MDEEELYRELRIRRIRGVILTLCILAGVVIGGYFLVESMLASMGMQAAPENFGESKVTEEAEDSFAYGHVAVWTGESADDDVELPAYEVTVEDYRMEGLSHVGRPSATQEKLSTNLFIVVQDDPGDAVLQVMSREGVSAAQADTFTVLVRDNPKAWQTLTVFDPVTVTITVPDALVESAFVDQLVVYAVYNKQYPDNPGGLATLPVSVSEEDGICYASFLVRDEYEAYYALCGE